MAFQEDFSPFFDTETFGEEFIYTPKIGSSLTLVGIFDNAYFAVAGGEVPVSGSQPQIIYETSQIPEAPVYGEKITVKEKDYSIVDIHHDGTGTTTLILELESDGAC